MKLKLTIVVDTNDGNYATEISDITKEELEPLVPVFKAIYNNASHSWPYGEQAIGEQGPKELYSELTDDQIELFESYCPNPEYGFHTVKEITVTEIMSVFKYL